MLSFPYSFSGSHLVPQTLMMGSQAADSSNLNAKLTVLSSMDMRLQDMSMP